AVLRATPASTRWPTPPTAPPTTASASYVSVVMSLSSLANWTRTDADTVPGAPEPDALSVNRCGGSWSVSITSPAYLPLTAATPALTTIVYASGPTRSRRSQPGIVRTSTAGSHSAAYTLSADPCRIASPEIFMRCLRGLSQLPQLGRGDRHPVDADPLGVLNGGRQHRGAGDDAGFPGALDPEGVER